MDTTEQIIKKSNSRLELWEHFITNTKVKHMLELGVLGGDFAS